MSNEQMANGKTPKIDNKVLELAKLISESKTITELNSAYQSFTIGWQEKKDKADMQIIADALGNSFKESKLAGKYLVDFSDKTITKLTTKRKGNGSVHKLKVFQGTELVGEYATAKIACETLGLEVGTDSGVRVLEAAGYITDK